MSGKISVSVKINGDSFRAEGDPVDVSSAFAKFLSLASQTPKRTEGVFSEDFWDGNLHILHFGDVVDVPHIEAFRDIDSLETKAELLQCAATHEKPVTIDRIITEGISDSFSAEKLANSVIKAVLGIFKPHATQ